MKNLSDVVRRVRQLQQQVTQSADSPHAPVYTKEVQAGAIWALERVLEFLDEPATEEVGEEAFCGRHHSI